jgi:hypothetical protein
MPRPNQKAPVKMGRDKTATRKEVTTGNHILKPSSKNMLVFQPTCTLKKITQGLVIMRCSIVNGELISFFGIQNDDGHFMVHSQLLMKPPFISK